MAVLGTGTTFTLADSTFTANVISVSSLDFEVPIIDVTHLGTTGDREKEFGDLRDWQSFQLTYEYKSTESPVLPGADKSETWTLTYPIQEGSTNTTKSKWTGTGAVTKNQIAGTDIDGRVTAVMTVTPDGKTGPTFTAESA